MRLSNTQRRGMWLGVTAAWAATLIGFGPGQLGRIVDPEELAINPWAMAALVACIALTYAAMIIATSDRDEFNLSGAKFGFFYGSQITVALAVILQFYTPFQTFVAGLDGGGASAVRITLSFIVIVQVVLSMAFTVAWHLVKR